LGPIETLKEGAVMPSPMETRFHPLTNALEEPCIKEEKLKFELAFCLIVNALLAFTQYPSPGLMVVRNSYPWLFAYASPPSV